ncbi:MAG: thioredoxin [Candidatus Brocadiae bacterium]|nr:thioredoxin [Candidatus Brocadiia bacterium]
MGNAIELADDKFDAAIGEKGVAVVDFWATWCGPCKKVGPIMEELATQFAGKARIYKMDVDSNQGAPARFGVMSIPTVVFFKDGKEVDRVVGAQTKQAFEAKVTALL